MWISKRTDYATRAVLALAIAGEATDPVTLEELGAQTEVPTTVLSQVMPILRTAGPRARPARPARRLHAQPRSGRHHPRARRATVRGAARADRLRHPHSTPTPAR